MLDVKKLLTKILMWMKSPIVAVTWNDGSKTLGSGGTVTRQNINISSVVPSGYTPILAVMMFAGNYLTVLYTCVVDSAGLTYQIANRSTSSITVTPQFKILCLKDV